MKLCPYCEKPTEIGGQIMARDRLFLSSFICIPCGVVWGNGIILESIEDNRRPGAWKYVPENVLLVRQEQAE